MHLSFSFIIPVYNRPNEIDELLDSMSRFNFQRDFEIVIVEDGSSETAEEVIKKYNDQLTISYYQKSNSGPGSSRNYGMKRAKGDYFIILDSDVIMPSNYLTVVDSYLSRQFVHCFGGPDDAHQSFSSLQKAISFSMTSYLTTGGIRGKKSKLGKFQPRSFNMGISKEAFLASKGFGNIHPGEDPDLTIRLWQLGFQTDLIEDAKVFHKRRISWKKFYIQVNKFGAVRPILNHWHPETTKITYWFPFVFLTGFILSLALLLFGYWYFILFYAIYLLLIFLGASTKYKSVAIGLKSILAVLIQFYGYGKGFFKSFFFVSLLKKDPETKFPHLFFKDWGPT